MDYSQLISLKISSLKNQIKEVEKEKAAMVARYDQKISTLKQEIENLNPVIQAMEEAVKDYICPSCKGTGSVRRCDAAGQMEDIDCRVCNGRGFLIDPFERKE